MLRLTYSADENSKGEVPLVCLQHYQTAEPSGAKGVYVHTHTHTPGFHGKLCTHKFSLRLQCAVFVSVFGSSLCSACLYLSADAAGRKLQTRLK